MPRLPGICGECGAIYPSPLRADGPGRDPAFGVPVPCPLCGASGEVPAEVLERLEAVLEAGREVRGDEEGLARLADLLRGAARGSGEEPDAEEERVRRARMRATAEAEGGAAPRLAEALPGFRPGEVEAFVRLLRLAAEANHGEEDAGGSEVERVLEEAYDRHGPEEPADGGGPDPAEKARRRLREAGRNDPCPCGSGAKYKACHWREDLRTTR